MRIRIQHFFSLQIHFRIRIQFRIQGFDDQKFTAVKLFSDGKIAIYLSLGLQKGCSEATGEAFTPQKRTSSTSKHEILDFFLYLWVIFALLDPDLDPAPQINA
jgi:hypothetical protein